MRQTTILKWSLSILMFAILVAPHAGAQVKVDVNKITCKQYLEFTIADPRDINIWLSGYYHGSHGATSFDPQRLQQNVEKLKTACFRNENANLPVMQVIEKTQNLQNNSKN